MSSISPAPGSAFCPTCSQAYRRSEDALERTHSLLLAALEATADGILVVDLEGRTLAHNSRFLEMWGIPPDRMERGTDEELRRYVVDKLVDPAAFAARVEALYEDREARSEDIIRLIDGRVVERFSQPQRLDGQVVGRVWSFRDATARVTAEEELRSRERQLAETQRLARLGSWRWDVRANRVSWSDELYRIYGLDPVTFGATFEAYLARVHPDDVAGVQARLGRALVEGGRLEFEERVIRADGEVRVLRSMCEVTLDADGQPLHVVGACHDITEQRAAEDARRQSDSRFLTVFEQFPLGIHILSPDGRTREVNRAFRSLYGVDPAVLADFDPFTDPQLEDVRDLIARAFAGESVVFPQRPFRVPGREGADAPQREIWVQLYLCPVRSDDGSIREVIAVHQDVTESRAAADALAASEASYRAIFDASTDAVYVHDVTTGELLDVNRRACELHGRTREEFLALGLAAIDTGEAPFTLEDVADRIRAAAAGVHELFEWQAPHVDGHRTWIEVGLRRAVIGGKERLLANARDISERKNAELALQAANEELEVRVAERTGELAESNLALEEEIAERMRTEAELLRKTSELETIFQALPDGYFRLDADGTVLDHRPGALGAGLPEGGAVAGRAIHDVCSPNVAKRLREGVDEVRRTGELVCVEYSLPTMEGVREIEARLVPFGADQAVAIVRDVTDSRRSERELQRSEEHFRSLIENGSDLIIVVDSAGKTAYLSPSAERLLGWAPEERMGRSSFEMIHPDDVAAAAARRQEAIDNPGSSVPVDFRYRHKDGAWRTFEAFIRTLLPDSATGGLVVNARDVTSRKKMEAELQRSEQYFRTLIEDATDLITILGADGVIRYESAAIKRLFGYGQEELLGRSAFDLIHPEDLAHVVAAFSELVAEPGQSRAVEFRFRAADGSWRFLESVGKTVNPASADDGVVVNSRDIGERRAQQEALERARAEAEQANRAKSEFLSRMSHELRTPMNSILGFAQLLAKRATGDDQVRAIDHILKAGRHLLNLINEVLDIARIEANRQHLSLEPVRIDGAVNEAITLIRPLAAQYGCRVEDPGPLPDGFVMADRQRLAQVLLNLLSNAVKYNKPGGRVWVTLEPADDSAQMPEWQIAVHDTGPGIPADRMAELFVPFSRLGADLSEVEGTGLGLALSQRLVEAMEGTLEVRSTVGAGSTFTVRLAGAPNPLDRPGLAAASSAVRRTAPARPATLLYIEDNLANLTLVETILEGRPEITLLPALQGRLGLDLACQHDPDLILLDLHLPDIPGDEVLARLRDRSETRHIPIVVISADATPRRMEKLREAGVVAYLTKPLDVDEFLDAVDAVLERREA
jgi:PAS domain S-box-containing protein